MGKLGFFEKLREGSPDEEKPPEKPEVTEITVPDEVVEELIAEPKPEPSISGNSRDLKDKLDGARNRVSELRGQVKSSSAVLQSEQILETLDDVLVRIEELEADFKASACPKCSTLGFGANIQEMMEGEFQGINGTRGLFPFNFSAIFSGAQKIVKFKRCVNPDCGHIEVIGEEESGEGEGK